MYKAVSKRNRNAKTVIHPRSNAVMSGNREWTQRDRHLHKILMGFMIGGRNLGTISRVGWRIPVVKISFGEAVEVKVRGEQRG